VYYFANFVIDLVYVFVIRGQSRDAGWSHDETKKKNEILYFALRNTKLKIGVGVLLFFIVLTVVGPLLTRYKPFDYVGPAAEPPSAEFWFGTTTFGQDIFSQFVHGLGASFLVGIIGGGLATLLGILVGFTAGYRGGMVDVFRTLNPRPKQYTWWSNRGQAWAKNVGWRLDYHLATPTLAALARHERIFLDQRFSDHAPLMIDYDFRL
jgi:hypothetical protein